MLFAGKWTELANIMLSEVDQAQKVKACMLFPFNISVAFDYREYRLISHVHFAPRTNILNFTKICYYKTNIIFERSQTI
jgi:hypothetical protein